MSKAEDPLAAPDPLMLEALDWLARLSGSPTVADARAVKEWRARSPAHEAAFRQVAAFRRLARAMPADSEGAVVVPLRRRAVVSRRAVFAGGGALAAGLAGAAVVRPPLDLWPSLADLLADHHTGPGERYAFSPTAGVKVEMNSRTSVSRAGAGIRLLDGEAFVTVAPRKDDFTVAAADDRIVTRAAAFNVRAIDGEICVTCVGGSLENRRRGARLLVPAGEKLSYGPTGAVSRARVDVVGAMAWRRGLLIFDGTPLSEVVAEINRYRRGRVILADAALGARPVNAVFHTAQIDNTVPQIQRLLGVKLTRLPGDVVLIG